MFRTLAFPTLMTAAGGLLIAAAMITVPVPVDAAVCNTRDSIAKQLTEKYAEAPILRGLAGNGTVMEVYASDNGTWTIVFTRPDGLTCLAAAGEALAALDKPEVTAAPAAVELSARPRTGLPH